MNETLKAILIHLLNSYEAKMIEESQECGTGHSICDLFSELSSATGIDEADIQEALEEIKFY